MRKILVLALFLVALYLWMQSRPIRHGPGLLAPETPQQTNVASPQPFKFKDYTITPLAAFRLKARVLSAEHYHFDRESDLAPVDLALGWGRMSDEAILGRLDISQTSRYYFWTADELPIPRKEIAASSANMHLAPANAAAKKTLMGMRQGSVISLSGYLIAVSSPDGWHWQSSLSRTDTGSGACELVWVEQAEGK